MKRYVLISFILSMPVLFSCTQKQIHFNPVTTELGDLTEIGVTHEIRINDKLMKCESGQIFLWLRFKGKTEIPYQSAGGRDDYYVLMDSVNSSVERYEPVFVGTFNSSDKLSDQQDWLYHGTVTLKNDRSVFSGKVVLPKPEIVLLYQIQSTWQKLQLIEDGKRHILF